MSEETWATIRTAFMCVFAACVAVCVLCGILLLSVHSPEAQDRNAGWFLVTAPPGSMIVIGLIMYSYSPVASHVEEVTTDSVETTTVSAPHRNSSKSLECGRHDSTASLTASLIFRSY